jgi:DnaJ-class molecular chaperone
MGLTEAGGAPVDWNEPEPEVCGFCEGTGVVLGADASEAGCPKCKGQGVIEPREEHPR